MPIIIYCEELSNRLKYACYILFEVVLKVPYAFKSIEANPEDFPNFPSILYSKTKIAATDQNIFTILANPLLFETEIHKIEIEVGGHNELPLIFMNNGQDDLGFDVFSAIFFMVSRYEEYLPYTPDKFGRFPEAESLSGKFDFTHLPVVHIWASHLWDCLLKRWPDRVKPKGFVSALFSYDIDVAYAFKGRSLTRSILSLTKDFFSANFSNIGQKLKTGFGVIKDPSDTYSQIYNHPLNKLVFFLLASKQTKNDHNLSPNSKAIKQLIFNTKSSGIEVGIHPSYFSTENPELIEGEKKTLEKINNQLITKSRQHFLRFKTPQTFRSLIKAGITDDYSMQYAEMPGFRAGICAPYRWFDVVNNEVTNLTIHPGCIMETTFRDDIHLTAPQIRDWYQRIWEEVTKVNGCFICIWHNDTLSPNHSLYKNFSFHELHDFMIHLIEECINKQRQAAHE